jgi:hypothetical protein
MLFRVLLFQYVLRCNHILSNLSLYDNDNIIIFIKFSKNIKEINITENEFK